MSKPDLSTKVGKLKLENPTILASGIMGVTKAGLKRVVVEGGAGAVTMKSVTKEPREGHPNPVLTETPSGFLNAVGYSNSGYKEALEEFSDLSDIPAPVILSVTGKDAEEFAFLAKEMTKAGQFKAVEVVLSCPHTPGLGLLAGQGTPKATKEITRAVRRVTKLPLFVKVSPNVPAIGEVAKAAEKAGADAITAVNTAGPGMVIDVNTGKKVLAFGFGGLSGPAIKPIAIRCVYDVYEAVKIPVIGTGGVTYGEDAIQMFMAGASAVGIGTAVHYRGIYAFQNVCREIAKFMKERGYSKINDMVGKAHD
jgi:dihydroorotate dehydrogenase (NAD+) catalytic subunit